MNLRIDHNAVIPLHMQVEKLLRELVEMPNCQKGELFPKEVDIARQLGISRNTVRQAISKLVIEGILERKKGVGTRVTSQNINTQLKSWMSFTREMNAKGVKVRYISKLVSELNAKVYAKVYEFCVPEIYRCVDQFNRGQKALYAIFQQWLVIGQEMGIKNPCKRLIVAIFKQR